MYSMMMRNGIVIYYVIPNNHRETLTANTPSTYSTNKICRPPTSSRMPQFGGNIILFQFRWVMWLSLFIFIQETPPLKAQWEVRGTSSPSCASANRIWLNLWRRHHHMLFFAACFETSLFCTEVSYACYVHWQTAIKSIRRRMDPKLTLERLQLDGYFG